MVKLALFRPAAMAAITVRFSTTEPERALSTGTVQIFTDPAHTNSPAARPVGVFSSRQLLESAGPLSWTHAAKKYLIDADTANEIRTWLLAVSA